MKYKTKTQRGFTLIELLVVIAIMGVLSSIILASINRARSNARDAKRIAEINQMKKAVEIYYINHNRYPAVNDDLLVRGWSSMIDYLKADGILSLGGNQKHFALSNIRDYILPKASAYNPPAGYACPANIVPQDPQSECTAPLQAPSDLITHTYGYMSSLNQGWQVYRLRTKLENTNHFILRSGLTGDFELVGDNGCDTTQGYYCVGNAAFTPE